MHKWLVWSVVFVSACSPGRFEGTVGGHALSVKDALFFPVADAPPNAAFTLVLSDREGLCQTLTAQQTAPSSSTLVVTLFRLDDTGGPLAVDARKYDVATTVTGGGAFALGTFRRTDDACRGVVSAKDGAATSGSLKLDRLDSVMAGSFEFKFGPSGERGIGAFDARPCEIPSLPPTPVCL